MTDIQKRRLVRSTNLGLRSLIKEEEPSISPNPSRINLRQHALSCHFASKTLLTTKSDTMKRIERINRLRELEAEIVACLCISLDRSGNISLQKVLSDFLQYFENFYGDLSWIQGFSVDMVECLIKDWIRTEKDQIFKSLSPPTMFECCPVGHSETIGKRTQMEDRSIIMHRLDEKYASKYSKMNKKHTFQVTSFVGVFDGHAGCVAAEYARVHLGCNIIKSISLWNPNSLSAFFEDFQFAIHSGFSKTDELFLSYAKELDLSSGTCASIAFIIDFDLKPSQKADFIVGSINTDTVRNVNGAQILSPQSRTKSPSELGRYIEQNEQRKRNVRVLITANIGDSRIILCRNGEAVELSEQHKPDTQSEKERIEAAGGRVIWWMGQAKVNGVLGVSRAIGDVRLKDLVISKPFVQHRVIEDEDEFVILASDGLWDVFSPQEACTFVQNELEKAKKEGMFVSESSESILDKIAKKIIIDADERKTRDNVTVNIIALRKYEI